VRGEEKATQLANTISDLLADTKKIELFARNGKYKKYKTTISDKGKDPKRYFQCLKSSFTSVCDG
jgi:hypothetical protein